MIAPAPRETALLAAAAETGESLSSSVSQPVAPTHRTDPYFPGEVIADRYRLVRELGRGGMGVVWVARSLQLHVDVALKLIRADHCEASRMPREAHAAARLGHPALVRVFDFGWTSRGDPFLVMELVLGETLSKVLAREKRIDPIRAVQLVLPLADGLRVAHESHIVHRDIKPDNIFLATDTLGRTQPKLIDFGIAKVDLKDQDRKITQIGVVLGSPEYMSPEQSRGVEDVDERTDIWSLSVVLYELVTGTIPFSKPNYNALMQSIIHDAPKTFHDHDAEDGELWAVVQRGLAKDRNQRWSSMTELGEALARWLHTQDIKEDLSGNSIRAVWLDRKLLGLGENPRASMRPKVARLPSDALDNSATQSLVPEEGAVNSSWRRRGVAMLAIGAALGGVAASLAFGPRREGVRNPTPVAESSRYPASLVGLPWTMANGAPSASARVPSEVIGGDPLSSGEGGGTAAAPTTTEKHLSKGPPPPQKNKKSAVKPKHDFGF